MTTIEELRDIYPDLLVCESHLYNKSRMLKRQNEYDRETFLEEDVAVRVDRVTRQLTPRTQDECSLRDKHCQYLRRYFASEYPPFNKHLIPKVVILADQDMYALAERINDFLGADVSRLISLQMIPGAKSYTAMIVYYPY